MKPSKKIVETAIFLSLGFVLPFVIVVFVASPWEILSYLGNIIEKALGLIFAFIFFPGATLGLGIMLFILRYFSVIKLSSFRAGLIVLFALSWLKFVSVVYLGRMMIGTSVPPHEVETAKNVFEWLTIVIKTVFL
jgi:hypothetical protein